VAIGNALGKFDNTVTTGVISGIGRGITATDSLGGNSESLEGLIQTDAAINPGNSGGPLLNLAGEVIGIATATASSAQNIGFAVPSNTAQAILNNYLKNGKIIRPFLGVGTVLLSKEVATLNNLPQGALVRSVQAGSAAEKAGIKVTDIVTELGGQKIDETTSLAKALGTHQVGEKVTIKMWRTGGEIVTVTATLTEAP
jgi:serine protease Do